MHIALIVAAAGTQQVIGNKGDMPWHFSSDLEYFKKMTMGQTLLMGRKTYQSILARLGKPLPGRHSVVLTHDKDFQDDRVTIIHEIDEIRTIVAPADWLFVIGGAQLYEQMIAYADLIYLTHIDHEYEGDAFFPVLNPAEWTCVNEKTESEDDVTLRFCTYKQV